MITRHVWPNRSTLMISDVMLQINFQCVGKMPHHSCPYSRPGRRHDAQELEAIEPQLAALESILQSLAFASVRESYSGTPSIDQIDPSGHVGKPHPAKPNVLLQSPQCSRYSSNSAGKESSHHRNR
mmetsp:Transcript_100391/g.184355  ORF Transcript_100391/g.184355 Transcript_100391/m.184355 type:complete len:126 (-) Transcript_100391:759-1136(-)